MDQVFVPVMDVMLSAVSTSVEEPAQKYPKAIAPKPKCLAYITMK